MSEKNERNLRDIQYDYEKTLMYQFNMTPEDIVKKMDNDDEFYDNVKKYSYEYFADYEIYDYWLFELAGQLYHHGYNVLEKAIEWESDNPLLVNSVLEEYILDKFLHERDIINTNEFIEREKKREKERKEFNKINQENEEPVR